MSKILTVLKKELRRFFTDKRMLISIFLPGILIFVIYSLMGNVVGDLMNQENKEFIAYIENEPAELVNMYNVEGWNVRKYINTPGKKILVNILGSVKNLRSSFFNTVIIVLIILHRLLLNIIQRKHLLTPYLYKYFLRNHSKPFYHL